MKINIYRDFKGEAEIVGALTFEREEDGTFLYDKNFVETSFADNSLGISHKLPVRKDVYYENEFKPFFQGLLPEGESLENISRILQVDRYDYKRLLYKLGCESIGALTFISENEDIKEFTPDYDKVNNSLIQKLKETPTRAVQMNVADIRLSLSGAQTKTAWFLPWDINSSGAKLKDWLIPRNTAPSSHIIKIFNRENLDIAYNEFACSLISRACGIETCEINLLDEIPGAIAIKRFDRYWESFDDEEKLVRLHQEDFCQAMGFPGYAKYQSDSIDGDYLMKIYDLIEEVSSTFLEDVNEIAKRTVFNYIIGNSDAHLKNFSFLYNKNWTARKLAPMYDVTCIPLTGYSTEFAFTIGEHRLLDEIDKNDILSIALSLDINLTLFDKLINEILNGIQNFKIDTSDKQLKNMIDKILDNAKPRIKILKDLLAG